jgi:hypothetical protein
MRHGGRRILIAGIMLGLSLMASAPAYAQDFVVTALVLVNAQNTAGYGTNPQAPGEFQRFTERYLEHLQIPYQIVDVATQGPPADIARRQLIISAHRGINPSAAWQTAIANAVAGGAGFVNLDSDATVGQQAHMQNIFGARGSSVGAPGTAIRVPQAVLADGSAPHFIAALQRRFRNDPPGDITYAFHADGNAVVQPVRSTVLTAATGTVIAAVGADPLILATASGSGRAVHFGTLEYLRADRFGFLMGVDDLFWRSLVWAARKPFVVRGYPRLWAIQMDDTLEGWSARVRDLYDVTLTGETAADGTGGPWRVTGFVFTDNLAPGSVDRASVIADINAGRLQVSPHARGQSYGDLYWETRAGQPLDETTWFQTVNDIVTWMQGNGGTDTIPFLSRSMVPHYWNLQNITGDDLWTTLGFRYITEIQRPGIDFFNKTDTDRLRLRPFRLYELPPASSPDENYSIYLMDDYAVNSRTGLPARTFFAFATQIIDLTRYDRQDLGWPNTVRPVEQTVDNFEFNTWRLWSSLAPVQIYTHDGSNNMILSTAAQRRQVVQSVSAWLNAEGVRHVFMQDVGDYAVARTRSVLSNAQLTGSSMTLTFTGNATTADGQPVATDFLLFVGDTEGIWQRVAGFAGGASVDVTVPNLNPTPTTTALSPASAAAGGPAFTLTVTGTNFTSASVVRWNGAARPTTFVSATQLTSAIPASDITTAGTAQVTVFNPAPGGGTSNPQVFAITANNPIPTTTALSPTSTTVGGSAFTLTVTGTNFISSSVVRWNGANRATTFVSATQLTATISPADIATAGTAQVTVFNPAPGGGASNAQSFSITNPVPATTNLTPNPVMAGGAGFTLTVTGTNFVTSSVVRWNGANRPTTYISPTQVTAAISAADIAVAGTAQVTVVNPAPGGGTSNAQTATILNPVPTISSLNPGSGSVGGSGFVLTVTGTNFVTNSVVRWNGADRPTTYVSPTQVTAAIPATDLLTAGTARVTVFNPPPGGGLSNSMNFAIGLLGGF